MLGIYVKRGGPSGVSKMVLRAGDMRIIDPSGRVTLPRNVALVYSGIPLLSAFGLACYNN